MQIVGRAPAVKETAKLNYLETPNASLHDKTREFASITLPHPSPLTNIVQKPLSETHNEKHKISIKQDITQDP